MGNTSVPQTAPPSSLFKGKRVWRDLGKVTAFQRAFSSGFWEKEQGSREQWGHMGPGAGCSASCWLCGRD